VSERVDPTTIEIPHWLLNFEELTEVLIGRTEFAATSGTASSTPHWKQRTWRCSN